jgi:hypothetical protein
MSNRLRQWITLRCRFIVVGTLLTMLVLIHITSLRQKEVTTDELLHHRYGDRVLDSAPPGRTAVTDSMYDAILRCARHCELKPGCGLLGRQAFQRTYRREVTSSELGTRPPLFPWCWRHMYLSGAMNSGLRALSKMRIGHPTPMARLTLVHRIAGSGSNQAEFINIINKGFDYFSEAYVTLQDLEGVRQFFGDQPVPAHPEDQITNILNRANHSHSIVESTSASLLVLNEWFTPAWNVRVNGKKQPILRVNQWQTGVLLPAGKNSVEFDYSPTLFRVLTALNRITILLLLAFVIFAVTRKGSAQATW